MEVYQDAHVYDTGMICIVEIMGRHAGWLTAAAALATKYGAGPDLIYLPETDFDMDTFLADVQRVYKETGSCMVAVSEGIIMPMAALSPRPRPARRTALATRSSAASPRCWRAS
jgi:6-phosphofructokinase